MRSSRNEPRTIEKLIHSLDAIMFEATAIQRAVDAATPSDLIPVERRETKAAARNIFDEADRLMTRVTKARDRETKR